MIKKFFTLRSILTLVFLLIGMSAFLLGIKTGVRNVSEAAFFPIAAWAAGFSYILGLGASSTRRAWTTVILTGLFVIFMEAARIRAPLLELVRSIPMLELDILRALLKKEMPNLSEVQGQFAHLAKLAENYLSQLVTEKTSHPIVRETLWDIPILFIAAWSGWWTSRRNQILTAMLPSLALNGYILYYTNKEMFPLQIAVFALIMLMGINQKWSLTRQEDENIRKARNETYSAILLLSLGLAVIAGLTPSISIKSVAQRVVGNEGLGKVLGLDRKIANGYAVSGLPRQHLLGLSPANSQAILFIVKTGELAPTDKQIITEQVPNHRWRWLLYDVYDGAGWFTSAAGNETHSANQPLFSTINGAYQVIHQQVEKALIQDNRLYWTGTLTSVNQPFESSWRTSPESLPVSQNALLTSDMLGSLTDSQVYSADSIIPLVTADQLRDSSQNYPPEIRTRYLSLPDTVTERVLLLAEELTADRSNPYDKAKAIESYMRTYPYTLNVPPFPAGREIADYFLFDLKTGYCDYYATSMIVLARAAGLPARLVIGYASGAYDAINAEYVVREADAHSWVEIYFAGIGWVEFEPTAGQPLLSLPETSSDEEPASIIPFVLQAERRTSVYTKSGHYPKPNYLPAMLGSGFILFISSLWLLRTQGLLRVHPSIESIYVYIYYHGKQIHKEAAQHETPIIFSQRLKRKLELNHKWLEPAPAEIDLLTRLYIQETYSAHPITKNEREQAIKVWQKLFWRLLYARFIVHT